MKCCYFHLKEASCRKEKKVTEVFLRLAPSLKFTLTTDESHGTPELKKIHTIHTCHTGEDIKMLFVNYGNFANVVTENRIKTVHSDYMINVYNLQSILILLT